MGILSGIIAVIKAVPIIDKWIEQFCSLYISLKIESMKKENRDAIRKSLAECDQRELEKALGNPNAGEASNNPGTVIQPTKPPGV